MLKKNVLKNLSLGIIFGAVIGAVIALLYAPASGKEVREKIQSGAEEQWQKATEKYEQIKESQGEIEKSSSVESTTVE